VRPKSKEERNVELRRDAARIVAGVESYSSSDRARRAAEVKAAFPPAKAAPAKAAAPKVAAQKASALKAAAPKASAPKATAKKKAAPKGPTSAGVSVGPHDGDVC
jgi:hypothetical protein